MALLTRPVFPSISETIQMDINDPRRGYFPTGPSTPTTTRPTLSFGSRFPTSTPSRSGPALSFGSNIPSGGGFADFFSFGSSGLSFGEPVTATPSPSQSGGSFLNGPTTGGIVRGDIDGQSNWQAALSGLGGALLDNIGARRDAPAPQLQQASFGGTFDSGPNFLMLGALAAAGVGLYFLVK